MNRIQKAIYLSLFLPAIFLFPGISVHSAVAETAPTPTQSAAIQQAVESGQVTPQQVQQGLQMMESGQISGEAVEQMKQKAEMGNLTPEDIAAGKKILEKGKAGQDGGELEQSQAMEEEYAPEKEEKSAYPGLEIFGHNLFRNPPSTFAPIKDMPVSNDYVIGPGDEINILMWGRIDASYNLVVDNEGVIQFPKIGPLTVAGQTFAELKDLIRQKAEAITGVNVNVSMGKLRSIQVFVLGEVKSPGVYTVSSLATVTNALLSSGGPTALGSLRKVELKRNNRHVSTLDFYDFLMSGDTSTDARLMPGDVIFVPTAGPMVMVSGNVKRPAVYEFKESMTLNNALQLAGGLDPRAFNQRIQIERASENSVQVVLDIAYDRLNAKRSVSLQDGDIVKVSGILPGSVNAIFLYGNVLRPGEYAYRPGMKILDILPGVENLRQDTYYPYALIKRYQMDEMESRLIPFDLGKLLIEKDRSQNITLMPLDEIYIFEQARFKDKAYAEISGRIRKPGTYDIDKMTIRDLIFKAGQLERDAYPELGHLYRTDRLTKEVTIRTFNLKKVMADEPRENILLQDQDKVILHSIFDYNEKYTVSIKGTVNRPGEYPFAENMTIKDLIEVAGSVRDDAFLNEAELVRYHLTDGKSVETSIIKFNLRSALLGGEENLALYPMDVITVKQVPDWLDKKKSVMISGEVLFPGSYQIRKDEQLSDVIRRAGGYTDYRYLRGAVFTRESVRLLQQKRIDEMADKMEAEVLRLSSAESQAALSPEDVQAVSQVLASQKMIVEKLRTSKASGRVVIRLASVDELAGSRFDIILEDGDQLFIPAKPSTVNVLGAVYNPNAHIIDPERPQMKHYLARSGGPTRNADKKDVYIIRADGSVVSKNQGSILGVSWDDEENRWGFKRGFDNTALYPGDTILVPEQVKQPSFIKDMKDITQILYQIAVTAGITITQVF